MEDLIDKRYCPVSLTVITSNSVVSDEESTLLKLLCQAIDAKKRSGMAGCLWSSWVKRVSKLIVLSNEVKNVKKFNMSQIKNKFAIYYAIGIAVFSGFFFVVLAISLLVNRNSWRLCRSADCAGKKLTDLAKFKNLVLISFDCWPKRVGRYFRTPVTRSLRPIVGSVW